VCLRALLELKEDDALALWSELDTSRWCWCSHVIPSAVLRLGDRCVTGLLKLSERNRGWVMPGLSHLGHPQATPAVLGVLAQNPGLRNQAKKWVMRFPEATIAGALPVLFAAEPEKKPVPGRAPPSLRPGAVLALQTLAAHGQLPRLKALAEQAGCWKEVQEVLAEDTLRGKADPGLATFAKPAELPRARLRTGEALPLPAQETLIKWLRAVNWEAPPPSLAELDQALDPESLTELTWALFTAWQGGGAQRRESWAAKAVLMLGGEEGVKRFALATRHWRAAQQLNSSEAIGLIRDLLPLAIEGRPEGEAMLQALGTISVRGASTSQKELALKCIDAVAESLGVPAESLKDRLIPDLGLDAQGRMKLDYGPRQFEVGFDSELVPFVRDAAGARLRELPKSTKKDDATLSAEARETWKVLRREVKVIASGIARRLQGFAVDCHRWKPSSFREDVLLHPLLGPVSRGLIWGVYAPSTELQPGTLRASFRVGEDGSATDVDDNPLTVPEDAEVGLVHPAELTEKELGGWGQVLSDYEVIQPFPQLALPAFRLKDGEADKLEIDRYNGLKLKQQPLSVLTSWTTTGDQKRAELTLVGGLCALLDFSPTVYAYNQTITVGMLRLQRRDSLDLNAFVPWKEAHPVAVSKVLAEAEKLKTLAVS
jgi:hypothetical protein